jgi:hypothetical protein
MAYIGNQPVPQATQTRDRFVATQGQTTFATRGYTPGFIDVYLNGVKLDGSDYTAVDGVNVVLNSGADVDEIVHVTAYSTFQSVDALPTSSQDSVGKYLVSDGTSASWSTISRVVTTIEALDGQTVFTATGGYTVGEVDVYWNGVRLSVGDYTATNGINITLNTETGYGDTIEIVALGRSDNEIQPTITSVSGGINEDTDSTIQISGTGFVTGATVQFIDYSTGQFLKNSPTVIYTNSSSISATTGVTAQFPFEAGTRLTIRVTNPSGKFFDYKDAVVVSADAVWTTPSGLLFTCSSLAAVNESVAADTEFGEVTYILTSGALPAGLSLSTSGVITGTPPFVATGFQVYNFEITAYVEGESIANGAPRAFSISVGEGNDGSTSATAAASAQVLYDAGYRTDGYYWIDVNGTPTQVYCDMNTDGGGWMRLFDLTDAVRTDNATKIAAGAPQPAQFEYDENLTATFGTNYPWTRAAYRMQNNMGNGATSYFAWVSFDKPTTLLNPVTLRLPDYVDSNGWYPQQLNLSNCNVITNYDTNYVRNVTGITCRLEKWPWNYGNQGGAPTPFASGGVHADVDGYVPPFTDGNDDYYDYNDYPSYSETGYGCVQIADMDNGGTIIFAFNSHRAEASEVCVGFGDNGQASATVTENASNGNPFEVIGTSDHMDWTFADNGAWNFRFEGWIK